MMRSTWIGRTMLALTLTAAAGSTADAGLLPVSVTVIPEAGNFRWTYAIVLPTDMKLQAGNYFTVYDFAGLVPDTQNAPDGWTAAVGKAGPTPDRLRPNDDPAVDNLTWTYTGPTIPSGQIGLGNFWAVSTFDQQQSDFFTARTNRTSDGLTDSNITDTVVPVAAGGPDPNLVPEPTTLALAALGLPLVGLVRRMRRTA